MKSCINIVLLLLTSFWIIDALIYHSQNVSPGSLPSPLLNEKIKYNIIQVGAGTGGSLSAALLAQSGCLKVLVLEAGSFVDFNNQEIGIVPGTENNAYFKPGLEKQFLQWPNPVIHTNPRLLPISVVRKGDGGDQRISHYAAEWGDNRVHKARMSDPLGNPPEWEVGYIWGHVTDKLFNFVGAGITPNHANLGRLRLQESRDSAWQSSWLTACSTITGASIVTDFNVINGSINTCSAEPSNIRETGIRSVSENEYLIPEAETNPNLDVVYNAKITRILFDVENENDDDDDDDDDDNTPTAIGVEGLFSDIPFKILFHPSQSYWGGGDNCNRQKARRYRQIILSTGAYENVQLLELSGIGPADELTRLGIRVLKDIPAVGKHLEECSSASMLFVSANGTREDIGLYPTNTDLITSRPGAFVSTGTRDAFLLWTPFLTGPAATPTVNGLGLSFELVQDLQGSVRLLTPNYADRLNVSFNWDASTLAKHVEAFRKLRQIINDGGIAARFQMIEIAPGPTVITDQALSDAVTRRIQAINHASGSTRMTASGDPTDGVVDLDFKVLGVDQLMLGSNSVLRYSPSGGGKTWAWKIGFTLQNKVRVKVGAPVL